MYTISNEEMKLKKTRYWSVITDSNVMRTLTSQNVTTAKTLDTKSKSIFPKILTKASKLSSFTNDNMLACE